MGYQNKPGDTGSLPQVVTGLYETRLTVVQTAEADTQVENSGKSYLHSVPNGVDAVDYIPYGGVYERPDLDGTLLSSIVVDPPPDPEPGDPCNLRDVEVSYLYPIMNIESANITHAFVSGEMFTWLPGEVDITHSMLGGTLVSVLSEYDMLPESIDMVHSMAGGSLVTVLYEYDMLPESIDMVHSMTGGTLLTILLTYSNWPAEGADISHSMLGGTLV